jgi:hypothetical protein
LIRRGEKQSIGEARALFEGAKNTNASVRIFKVGEEFCLLVRLAGRCKEMYLASDEAPNEPMWFMSFQGMLDHLEANLPESVAKNFCVTLLAVRSDHSAAALP